MFLQIFPRLTSKQLHSINRKFPKNTKILNISVKNKYSFYFQENRFCFSILGVNNKKVIKAGIFY